MKFRSLYIAWGVLFAVTAALGFCADPADKLLTLMRLLTVAFFLPPFAIVSKARLENQPRHLKLVRQLAIAWLAATVILICANILSVRWSGPVGNFLYCAMTVICAPLVCSNLYGLPIFLWGMVLTATLGKKK